MSNPYSLSLEHQPLTSEEAGAGHPAGTPPDGGVLRQGVSGPSGGRGPPRFRRLAGLSVSAPVSVPCVFMSKSQQHHFLPDRRHLNLFKAETSSRNRKTETK